VRNEEGPGGANHPSPDLSLPHPRSKFRSENTVMIPQVSILAKWSAFPPDSDTAYWAARDLYETACEALACGRASVLPSVDGRGLTPAERTRITRAGNEAGFRAARLVGDNGDPYPCECSRVAAEIELRCVLARRSMPAGLTGRELAKLDAAFDAEIAAGWELPPIRGGSPGSATLDAPVEFPDYYEDEAPELSDADCFEPEPDDTDWWAQTAEQQAEHDAMIERCYQESLAMDAAERIDGPDSWEARAAW
jgi:hypothetical protein